MEYPKVSYEIYVSHRKFHRCFSLTKINLCTGNITDGGSKFSNCLILIFGNQCIDLKALDNVKDKSGSKSKKRASDFLNNEKKNKAETSQK